jgi:serine protease DegQ
VLVAISILATLAVVGVYDFVQPEQQNLTQRKLADAVNLVIDERPRPPSVASLAYARIIPSVVQVSGLEEGDSLDPNTPDYRPPQPAPPGQAEAPVEVPATPEGVEEDFHEKYAAIGTGVVIDDQGTILTNLHVAAAAKKLKVIFHDGTESEAFIIGAKPENDLAIIRPRILPDDLVPATLASSATLRPGDEVVAVGFPFGIGPSASFGVVSGLLRVLEQEGEERMQNLIQFDAAANPGNSGGPLVNAEGEVVGIVTAILNPSGIRTFLGIGFAVPIETAAGAAGESPL